MAWSLPIWLLTSAQWCVGFTGLLLGISSCSWSVIGRGGLDDFIYLLSECFVSAENLHIFFFPILLSQPPREKGLVSSYTGGNWSLERLSNMLKSLKLHHGGARRIWIKSFWLLPTILPCHLLLKISKISSSATFAEVDSFIHQTTIPSPVCIRHWLTAEGSQTE